MGSGFPRRASALVTSVPDAGAAGLPIRICQAPNPPSLKWSDVKFFFGIKEDRYAEEEHKPEEIVTKLRQVDVLVSQGQGIADAIRQIGVGKVSLSLAPETSEGSRPSK